MLWTAAHHHIPLLTVMHNNRAYHQERMYVTDMAAAREARRQPRATSATTLDDPEHRLRDDGEGLRRVRRRTDRRIPKDLGPALKRAIDVVKRGEPALVDVVTQPR